MSQIPTMIIFNALILCVTFILARKFTSSMEGKIREVAIICCINCILSLMVYFSVLIYVNDIRKKEGPPGPRGVSGPRGSRGPPGRTS